MNKKTEIVMIVDRSGSMSPYVNDTIGGLNSFIKEQKSIKNSEANLTLIFFGSDHEVIHDSVDLREINELEPKDYVISGSTALFDALGFAITTLKDKKEKEAQESSKQRKIVLDETEETHSEKVIFGIITDGEENSSRKYSKSQIFDMIKDQRSNGWEFIFLSADEKAIQDSKTFGISSNNTYSFKSSSEGFNSAYDTINLRASAYRSSTDEA